VTDQQAAAHVAWNVTVPECFDDREVSRRAMLNAGGELTPRSMAWFTRSEHDHRGPDSITVNIPGQGISPTAGVRNLCFGDHAGCFMVRRRCEHALNRTTRFVVTCRDHALVLCGLLVCQTSMAWADGPERLGIA
jgi:hypothetical protein